MLPARKGIKTPDLDAAAALPPAHVDDDEMQAVRTKALLLWDNFLALGEHGTLWTDYEILDEEMRDKHMELWIKNAMELPLSSLTGHLGWLQRWKDWALRNMIDWRACRPTHFAIYLDFLQG